MAKLDDYLTIQQCAAELGCASRTIERWIKEGRMPKPERKVGIVRLMHRKHCKRPTDLDPRGSSGFGKKKEVN